MKFEKTNPSVSKEIIEDCFPGSNNLEIFYNFDSDDYLAVNFKTSRACVIYGREPQVWTDLDSLIEENAFILTDEYGRDIT